MSKDKVTEVVGWTFSLQKPADGGGYLMVYGEQPSDEHIPIVLRLKSEDDAIQKELEELKEKKDLSTTHCIDCSTRLQCFDPTMKLVYIKYFCDCCKLFRYRYHFPEELTSELAEMRKKLEAIQKWTDKPIAEIVNQ